jgi:hypothetical protein
MLPWVGRVVIGVACAVGALAPFSADGQVTVDRKPPVVERRTFDPHTPPAEMPPLNPKEAAITQSQFDCSADVDYKVIDHKSEDGICHTSIRVEAMHVTLNLKVILWLPAGAPTKLVAHEEGHRQIAAQVLEQSDDAAREIATGLIGLTFTKSAADCEAAEQRAAQAAADEFCQQYLHRIGARAGRINDAYDQFTGHGTRSEPTEEEAIRQAFACEQRGLSAGLNGRSVSKQ